MSTIPLNPMLGNLKNSQYYKIVVLGNSPKNILGPHSILEQIILKFKVNLTCKRFVKGCRQSRTIQPCIWSGWCIIFYLSLP